jgi:hypothetical protein
MSINSFSSVQSFINKKTKAAVVPFVIATISNLNAPAPFQPFFYLSEATSVRNSSNNGVSECTCVVISNQTSPYTFTNGTYFFKTSSTLSTAVSGAISMSFYGDSVPDVFLGPAKYYYSGIFTGSTSTNIDGTNILGEWVQIQLSYTLYVTTYSVNGNLGGGGSWNAYVPKSFYLCGSNDGTNWSRIDNRTGIAPNANLLNSFTAPIPDPLKGYKYFRLKVGVFSNTHGRRMGVCIGLRGTYRG